MTVLVVGGGGREHAVCAAIKKSPKCTRLLCAPGNGGIAKIAECFPTVSATDVDAVVELAKRENVDYVAVTTDEALAAGTVDALEVVGIPAFGPRKNAAIIESSKAFSKALMKKYNIPTAKYEIFDERSAAVEYVKSQGAPIVVKADGLALGKGVVVAQTVDEAIEFIDELMLNGKFGASGAKVVIEEYLTGREVTALVLTDGKTLMPLPSSMDHKRVYDNDEGPNTGGMGAISPSPLYSREFADASFQRIFIPTMNALNAESRTFKGVIYFELMLTTDGPKVIEYNARFGDPETQAVLPLIKSDMLELMLSVTEERLSEMSLELTREASCCVVVASGGYPVKYDTGKKISGIDDTEALDAIVYHAGTKLIADGEYVTSGGRVLGVTCTAADLPTAIQRAYSAVEKISFDGMHYRKDIGRRIGSDDRRAI
ncbi:MAG: phosphoribosylamine--glycine ligase [Oscillospiraceae bacterium]|nr:phosphoribosylamine--glycine ligase [Oscillospiraceae bacterium]